MPMRQRRRTVGTERKPIHSQADWVRNQERRAGQQERRRVINSASDLLGGGFGPTATLIQDWNDPQATFNGFFYSVENLSLNSPDGSLDWAGIVVAEVDNGFGIQEVWASHAGTPPRRYTRRWETVGSAVAYTPWVGQGDWITTGIVSSGCTILEQAYRVNGLTVTLSVEVSLTVALTSGADGNLSNTQLLQVPVDIAPVNCPRVQGEPLACGASGPLCSYAVLPTGVVNICATVPSTTLPVGQQLSIGGTYSL